MPTIIELQVENNIVDDVMRAIKPQFRNNRQVAPLREKLQRIIEGGGVTEVNYSAVTGLVLLLAPYLDFKEFCRLDEPIESGSVAQQVATAKAVAFHMLGEWPEANE